MKYALLLFGMMFTMSTFADSIATIEENEYPIERVQLAPKRGESYSRCLVAETNRALGIASDTVGLQSRGQIGAAGQLASILCEKHAQTEGLTNDEIESIRRSAQEQILKEWLPKVRQPKGKEYNI